MSAAVATVTADHARRYAEHGWKVWPIRPRRRTPYTAHGCRDATDNVDVVADWWRRWPYASIGGLVPPGLVVVDLDPRNGCAWTPDRFARTLTVATGRGWHCYFEALVELAAHSDAVPGVDVITSGHQVTLPPSIHPNGERYKWVNDIDPVPLPGLIIDFFKRRPVASATTGRTRSGRYLDAARRGVVADLARAATPGNRWRALTAASLRFRDIGLSVDDALADLLPPVPLAPDFTEGEARAVITGVWRR